MAFPTVAARTGTSLTTAGTSFTITFTQTTDDLVVIFMACVGQGTITVSDSFTNWSNTNARYHVIYKILDGSEGGNVVVTQANGKSAAVAYNIQDFDTASIGSLSAAVAVSGLNPDPPSVSPGSVADHLYLTFVAEAAVHENADNGTWATAAPSNYTNLTQKTSGTGGAATSNCMIASAERQLNADFEDPGTFTVAISITSGNSRTAGINPAAAVERVPKSSSYPQLIPQ